VNLSREIGNLLSEDPKLAIKDVIAKIKAKHPKANEGSIKTSYYTNPNRAGGRRRRKAKRGAAVRSVARGTRNGNVTVEDLKAAKRLIEIVGSQEKALAAIKAYGELV
jgi:hypothetical protein